MSPCRRLSTVLLCVLAIVCTPAHAQFTQSELQIAGRALAFLEKPLNGDVKAGIVYAPADPQSVRAAEDLRDRLGSGLRVGNLTLKPVMVPVTDVGRADVALFLLVDGMSEGAAKAVTAAAASKHAPCITTDLSQVQSGVCAMGIRAQPKVQILVNRAAAASSGLAFCAVFRMMITET
jgi:ABC-type uncharacterized transport system substrate-binding protein